MTRPTIIRADSIDLQDTDAPSAKDHRPRSNGPSLAPHQAETLREVANESLEENHRSPRLSWAHGDNDGVGDLSQYAEDLAAGVQNKLGGSNSPDKMQKEDNLAVAQNGGHATDKDDDSDADTDESLEDDMMDKISSSPSIEDEDIDFEFVYALHTFVATVEGQANATKGDTMVLLDDSNSYWWLVRVVKDSSIGYLPAEHIETPTERLARLNKHRNIDLSATMLQDQNGEKPKPGLRSLMGKKKKTVVFTDPTYVDYSDYASSGDEDEDSDELFGAAGPEQQNGNAEQQTQQEQQQQQQDQQQTNGAQAQQGEGEVVMVDDTAKVEPLKPRGQKDVTVDVSEKEGALEEEDEGRPSSDQFFERPEGPSRSRNGTVRNTDSFFKDETVETKKITLTPKMLLDEPRPSNESGKEMKRPSLDKAEKFERELATPDSKKDEKKKKEKKPSAIRSFFSRKDKKKSSADGDDDDSLGKRSMDTVSEDHDDERQTSFEKPNGPQRNPSKLQKAQPRSEAASPTRKGSKSSTRELADFIASEGGRTNDVSNVPPASMRIVQEQDGADPVRSARSTPQPREDKSALSKIRMSRTGSSEKLANKPEKPRKVTKAKSRVELDDFDSSDDDIVSPTESMGSRQHFEQREARETEPERKPSQDDLQKLRPQLPGAFPDSYSSTQSAASNQSEQTIKAAPEEQPSQQPDRLSESPVYVSPPNAANPPALVMDTSSQEDQSSESPSPELGDNDGSKGHQTQDSVTSTSTSGGNHSWNDSKLRAFFETSSDVRDMLVMVYDKSDVPPAGPDHPVAGPLFREQNARLAEITTQLDNMLGDWLARKQRMRGTV